MTIDISEWGGRYWVITPATTALSEKPPDTIEDQKWLLVLSGVGVCNLKGQKTTDWTRETITLNPMPDMDGPLDFAIAEYHIHIPAGASYYLAFQVEQWSPFATINAIFDERESNYAGFAVDDCRMSPFSSGVNTDNQLISNVFTGITIDAAVRDSDAWLYRIGYNITLLGKIVFLLKPVIE